MHLLNTSSGFLLFNKIDFEHFSLSSSSLLLFIGLLYTYLGRHYSLSFCDQGTFWAETVFPTAITLVAFESADNSMIPASGALGSAWKFVSRSENHRRCCRVWYRLSQARKMRISRCSIVVICCIHFSVDGIKLR